MCFIVTDPELKIAVDDIICYKEVTKCANITARGFYYRRKIYQIGMSNKIIEIKRHVAQNSTIDKGYHSYITKSTKGGHGWMLDAHPNAIFIIPKGTKYYKNRTEYVSENIIFKDWLTKK